MMIDDKLIQSIDKKIKSNEKLKNRKIEISMNYMRIYNFSKTNMNDILRGIDKFLDKLIDSVAKIDKDTDIEIDMNYMQIDYLKSDKICKFCDTTIVSDFEESEKDICIECNMKRR